MNLLVILSHDLTDKQIEEAKGRLKVDRIKTMPDELKDIWQNINPIGELPLDVLNRIINWIEKESEINDYVLVQGDFGSSFYIVDFCFKAGRIPIYSTSNRRVKEIKEGEKILTKRIFKHETFRRYVRYQGHCG